MNALEKIIFEASFRGARTYGAMTGGAWLWEGPEHFLQNEIARAVWRTYEKNRLVWIDLPNKNIHEWADLGLSRDPRRRPDIVILNRSCEPIAVIEIKTKATVENVTKDAEKIRNSFRNKNHANAGYLLANYSGWKNSANGTIFQNRKAAEQHVEAQFKDQIKKLKKSDTRWVCVAKKIGKSGSGIEYGEDYLRQMTPAKQKWSRGRSFAWGIGLYRLK